MSLTSNRSSIISFFFCLYFFLFFYLRETLLHWVTREQFPLQLTKGSLHVFTKSPRGLGRWRVNTSDYLMYNRLVSVSIRKPTCIRVQRHSNKTKLFWREYAKATKRKEGSYIKNVFFYCAASEMRGFRHAAEHYTQVHNQPFGSSRRYEPNRNGS
ncbi:hypothetical protein SEUBUCD646_0G01140 [Saccharomyces eubayanus]|uniref:Uncharacterized protein n=1 Tax=Saccharomyces eubayanus TaxID=1080349 RepID=A0ABN8VYV5_SACEU|nr:hypothetical protein DI49_1813 [Saccharomyces eubayanus]KOG99362.1 hypothetical protein DI49_1813 [Saccharomyces eubayanus]CAI1986252.1 hypothetical protein SEUBUCD650_0G01150 [Saccharomyces eubayanus]CAI2012201.1 hypothetical protein SEUBUCD646_0G01140 [Saccharomyces eubayanus]